MQEDEETETEDEEASAGGRAPAGSGAARRRTRSRSSLLRAVAAAGRPLSLLNLRLRCGCRRAALALRCRCLAKSSPHCDGSWHHRASMHISSHPSAPSLHTIPPHHPFPLRVPPPRSLVDRDFNDADYRLLLRLDDVESGEGEGAPACFWRGSRVEARARQR